MASGFSVTGSTVTGSVGNGGTTAHELTAAVLRAGREAGLDRVGVAGAEILEPAATVLPERKAAGLHGDMAFTYRNPARSTDPTRALPGARAIVAGALDYRRAPIERPPGLVGRVAHYAWTDYYGALRQALEAAAVVLRDAGYRAVVHADDNHLVDRNVAYRAGLGWYGKNANLLLPGTGSWFVLGGVVTDAPLVVAEGPEPDGCGTCRRCLDGCPTDAIVAPGVVDARRCLAWLVQAKGPMPIEFRAALGDRLYGCDECQDVCPPNRVRDLRREPPTPGAEADPWIEIEWVLTADDPELLARVGRWYLAERNPDVVRRTALVILGNTGADRPETPGLLRRYLDHPNPQLRSHAVWAARRCGLDALVEPLRHDPDPIVRAEFEEGR